MSSEKDLGSLDLDRVVRRANNMRIARLKRGLSQTDMAKLIGTTQPTYSRIETGFVTNPKDEELIPKIAKVLGMKPRHLRESVRLR